MIVVRLRAMLRKLFACFSLSFVFLLLGCVSLARPELSAEQEAALYPLASYVPETFDWQEILVESGDGAVRCVVPGLWRFDFESRDPDFPLIYHAVKIELSVSGGAGTFGAVEGQETRGDAVLGEQGAAGISRFSLATSQWERTADFAAREKCLVAMNATPFDKTKLAGICKVNGKLLSRPVARYAALGLQCGAGEEDKSGRSGESGESDRTDDEVLCGRIFESQADPELEAFDAAFGGFFVVLRDGQVCTDFVRRHTSRSGAGLSADGKTLYLLVVEGERPRQSMGLSYPQCGEIFRAMGCSHALEFDGGGSSELCINGRSVLNYRVHRRQGNSIGFSYNSLLDWTR